MDEKLLLDDSHTQSNSAQNDVNTVQPASETPLASVESGQIPPQDPPNVNEDISSGELDGANEGFFKSPLFKKIVIGVVIFLLFVILIFIFMPKRSTIKNVKLLWWGLWEENRVVQVAIIDFKKTHPNIDIEYVKQDPQNYKNTILARIQNGTGPDIFRYHNTWVPMLSDILLPLPSDVVTLDEFRKNYYPVMQNDLIKNGGIYGIPLEGDTLALFVNTDLLQKAGVRVPQTWEVFSEVALKNLTVKDSNGVIKTAGAGIGTTSNINHAPDILSLLMLLQGVDMNKLSDSSDRQVDAFNFYSSFGDSGDKSNENRVWDESLDEAKLAFSKGNLAMFFGYSWDVFDIQQLNPDLKFTIHPVPQLPGVKKTVASYWVEGVSAKSPNQKEAVEFIKYLSKKETAQKLYAEQSKIRAFGEPYARVDLADSLKDNPLVYPFVSQLPYAHSSYFVSNTHDGEDNLNSILNNYLINAVNSIEKDGSSEETAMIALKQGIEKVFQKYDIQQE